MILQRVKVPPHPPRAAKINLSLMCDMSCTKEDMGHSVLAQAWICIIWTVSLPASGPKPEKKEQSDAASLPSTLLTLLCWTVEMIHQSCEVLGSLCWKGWLGRARGHQKSSWAARKARGLWHCSARAPCCRGWWRKNHSGSAGPCCSGAPGSCTVAGSKETYRSVTDATLAEAG